MLMVISTSNQLSDFSLFLFFSIKMIFFVISFYFALTNISKYLQQVFSLESLERTWLKESQLTNVEYYRMASYWVSEWVFAWDYWDGVWGVGGVGSLCCNGQSSFENRGSIPTQVTTIYTLGMCFRWVEK